MEVAEKERPDHVPDLDLKGGVGRVAPMGAPADRDDPSPPKHVNPEEQAQHRAPKRAAVKGRSPARLHALVSAGARVVVTDDELEAVNAFVAERPEDGSPDPDGVMKADLKHMLRRLDIRSEDR